MRVLSGPRVSVVCGIATAFAVALAPVAAEARRVSAVAEPKPVSSYPPAESLEGNYLAAYIAGASRDTAAAASYYRDALREDPLNSELQERAFISLLVDGDMDAAGRVAERLAARDASNGLAQLVLGVKAFKARQYGQVRTILARGGRSRAADIAATLLTAWAYAGARDGKRALETVNGLKGERGISTFRDYHAGLVADLVGNRQEAERRLKAAYDSDKTTLRIVDAYGRLLSRLGRRDQAIEVYTTFETQAPRHPFARYALAELNAGRTLPSFIETAQDGASEVLYGLASSASQGDELASLAYLRPALYLKPDHALALVSLAEVFERLKEYDQARTVLGRVPAGSPVKSLAEIQLGLIQEQMGRSDEAVQTLEKVKSADPDDTEALVALGNVLRVKKDYREAAAIYTQAIDRTKQGDVGRWPLFYYRGTTYERAKEWDKAEADLKTALDLVPDSQPLGKSQVLNYLGYSWVDTGRNLDEAFKMLKRAVELNPRDGMIIDSLGWAYYRLGDYDQAVKELEKAAELKSGDPVINDHLGDAFWQVGRRLEARFQWQHAKDANPEPDDLKKIDEKLAGGIPEVPKPAEAQTEPAGGGKSGG